MPLSSRKFEHSSVYVMAATVAYVATGLIQLPYPPFFVFHFPLVFQNQVVVFCFAQAM